MRWPFLILTFLISTLLISCEDNQEGGGYPYQASDSYDEYLKRDLPDVIYQEGKDYSGVKKSLQKLTFTCSIPAGCPNNIGLLLFNYDGKEFYPKIAQCTAFLVANDIIATNSHCIPDYLKSGGGECSSKMAVRFQTSEKESIFACKEILDYSKLKESLSAPDYGFVRIEPTTIEPLGIYKGGLKDNQYMKVVKMTPLQTSRGGRLEEEECKVAIGSLLNPKSTNSWSRTAVALGCDGVHGNSGSPVLNEKGEVIGILHAKQREGYNNDLEKAFAQFQLKLPPTLPPYFLFTNISCVDDPVTNISHESKCLKGENLHMGECLESESEKSSENANNLLGDLKNDLPLIFRYKYLLVQKTKTYQAIPICVKPKNSFDDYDKFVRLSGIYGFRKERIDLQFPNKFVIGFKFEVDEDYRINPDLNYVVEQRSGSRVELHREVEEWVGTINSTYSGTQEIHLTLPECNKDQLELEEIESVELENGDVLTEKELEQREKSYNPTVVCEK